MASTVVMTITDSRSVADLKLQAFPVDSGSPHRLLSRLSRYVGALALKHPRASMAVIVQNGDGAQASGTITLSSLVATDTCAINGVTFTCVASGATGNQFNVGASDTLTAVQLKNAINASTTAGITGCVVATSSGAVVTVKAATAGVQGNGYTLTAGTHNTVSGSGHLTGGVTDTATSTTYHYGL